MTYVEQWFPEDSQQALADLYRKTEGLEGRVVEIGSWEGRSTVALANACHPHIVHAVDTWEGSPGEISAELAVGRDVFGTWKRNIYTETQGNVQAFRMGWRDFVVHYQATTDDPVRFLFIDAEHTYVEVRDTIAAFLPLMAPRAVICGDDQHHPPVRDAVLEAFPHAYVVANLWWWRLP